MYVCFQYICSHLSNKFRLWDNAVSQKYWNPSFSVFAIVVYINLTLLKVCDMHNMNIIFILRLCVGSETSHTGIIIFKLLVLIWKDDTRLCYKNPFLIFSNFKLMCKYREESGRNLILCFIICLKFHSFYFVMYCSIGVCDRNWSVAPKCTLDLSLYLF